MYLPARERAVVEGLTTAPPFFFLMTIFTLASSLSVNCTWNLSPAFTLFGALTFLSGLANFVVNVWSPPLAVPSGLVATSWKWYVVQVARLETFADTFWVLGTLQ